MEELHGAESTSANPEALIRWAKKKGRKLAPGLAFVRAVAESDPFVSDYTRDLIDTDFVSFVRKLATPRATGLVDVVPCPDCGGDLTEPREFNLMFESHTGVVRDDAAKVYLRPETAQGIFVNFKNVLDTTRVKLPLGIAQIGKSFRNEINPRNYTFRSREFEQYEIEFFCHPSEAEMCFE